MNTIVKKCQLLHLLSAWGDSELCLAIFTDKCVTRWGNCFFFLNKTFIMKVNVKAKQSITLFTSHWLPQNLFSRFRPIEIWTNLQYEENWMHWIFYWQQCRSPFFESWRLVFCHLRQLFLGLFEFLWWLLVPRLGVRHDYVIGQAGAKYMSCCYECCLCIFANLNVSLSSYFTLFIREKHLDICRWISRNKISWFPWTIFSSVIETCQHLSAWIVVSFRQDLSK